MPNSSILKTRAGEYHRTAFNLMNLNELRDQAYENYLIYKDRTKKLHDSKIKNRILSMLVIEVVLFKLSSKLFTEAKNSVGRTFFTSTKVVHNGTLMLSQPDGPNFKVNGHRVKHYFRGDLPPKVVQDLHTLSKDRMKFGNASQAM
ncbi:hypothetical protein Tco_0838744 [Tanacetum coccineum]|uniref:Uncharacterized protein n=1 Tax=Tanacetum coccineum TaxID=301880 RepID=A0ABQ5ARK0_9ASTR